MRQSVRKKNSTAPYLSILLPLYNEEENIRLQYEEIVKAADQLKVTYEIVFVDDGSNDRSFDILSSIASRDRRVKLIQFRRNFGQTAAMAAGIDHSRGEVLVFMDSDLQNDPRDIGKLLEKIREGYDVVSGWRKKRKDNLFIRTIPSRIANMLIAWVSGVKLHDLGCSLKAYRGEVIRQVRLYGEMHRFIPVHASWVGASITEIPVNHNARRYGKSKYGIVRTFKVILDLFTVKFMGSFSTKPIYVFGGAAIVLFAGSILSGTAVILMKILLRHSMIRNPLLLLTVMFIILSTMFIMLGLLAEISIRTYHESQSMPPYRVKKTININRP
ncbi:MAG: glycosyltransferase family 2 protein [Spirochaetes bacterium]|jgi:glycosyltransferase involved in cell wall biosynthesis|nr:glycosyltransferase family 2 protein [Spirochaetota bacterium]